MSFFKGVGGSSLRVPFRAALAHGRVRFVGEPVALVVAETEHQAQDAAELIEVEYEDLPVVVEAADGISADSVRLHPDLPDNLAFDYEYGDRQSTDHGFEQAAHIVRVGLRARYNDNSISKFSGTGSFGSRSLISHGAGFATAAKEIVQKGLKLAAGHFEVSTRDVVFENGHYRVVGTDLSVTMDGLIEKVRTDSGHPLDTNVTIDLATAFPSGAHVAEVEIDPDTGAVRIVNYIAADDCGRIFNHKLVEGQLLGGMMQGIGQVFCEHIVYDPETGQLLSGTFMDYAMPRANDAAPTKLIDCGVLSPANSLGAKGAGEAGATGSVPALANAVLDALKAVNVQNLEMPYSPARIWEAIHRANRAALADEVIE